MSTQVGGQEREPAVPLRALAGQQHRPMGKITRDRLRRRTAKMANPVSKRLVALRKEAGYDSALEASRRMGVNPTTYQQQENGRRQLTQKAAELYARHFGVSAGYLMFGEQLQPNVIMTIVGTIGRGGIVTQLREVETMSVPLGAENPDLVGLRVEGAELWPAYHDGDIAFFDGDELARPIDKKLVEGRECVVILQDDSMLVRTVIFNRAGRAVLFSPTSAPGAGVPIRAAAPIRWVKRFIG